MSHTAGDWRVQPKVTGTLPPEEFYIVGPNHELSPEQNEDTTAGYCEFIAFAYGLSDGEAEANARLIAAAPDLLAACEAVQAICDQLPNVLYDVKPLIDAAVAKAKGTL